MTPVFTLHSPHCITVLDAPNPTLMQVRQFSDDVCGVYAMTSVTYGNIGDTCAQRQSAYPGTHSWLNDENNVYVSFTGKAQKSVVTHQVITQSVQVVSLSASQYSGSLQAAFEQGYAQVLGIWDASKGAVAAEGELQSTASSRRAASIAYEVSSALY